MRITEFVRQNFSKLIVGATLISLSSECYKFYKANQISKRYNKLMEFKGQTFDKEA